MGIDDAYVLGAGVDQLGTLRLGSGFFIILAGGYVQAADQNKIELRDCIHSLGYGQLLLCFLVYQSQTGNHSSGIFF